jgi:hypothetical protein
MKSTQDGAISSANNDGPGTYTTKGQFNCFLLPLGIFTLDK